MVLIDSSIWVHVEHGHALLENLLPEGESAAACPVVLLEVLRGTRTERYPLVREMLMSVRMYDDPTPLDRFEEAAQIYIRCRSAGVTPSAPDCLVAACAIAHGIPLLHDDDDFRHIARVVPSLKLI